MGNDSVIYIRTDGNSNIATGHLVRCLCIAEALETLGKSVCFLVSDEDSEALLRDLAESIFSDYSSFDINILETAAYNNLELEIDELVEFLNSYCISPSLNQPLSSTTSDVLSKKMPVLFIDSYFVTADYLTSLRKVAKVAYMDDLRAFDYDVDMVINYDVIPESKREEYHRSYTNAGITLLGAQYTPLRSQFQNQGVILREEIKDILITTGGSDPYHYTESLISSLLSQDYGINLHAVVGKLFQDTSTLEALSAEHSNVHLHHNVSNMAALMKQCDFAISAAGTTLYELCSLGIPAVSFTMADNQLIMAKTFDETEAVPYAGDIRNNNLKDASNSQIPIEISNTKSTLDCINKYLRTLIQDPHKRKLQQQKMRCLVDGNGALKIAKALCK